MQVNDCPSKEYCYIGIDGGGTKTDFALVNRDGIVIDRVLLGASNPSAVGLEGCTKVLSDGVNKLISQFPSARVAGVFAGLAGYTAGNNSVTIDKFFADSYPNWKVKIGSDIENLFGVYPEKENCLAVICGTGNVLCVKNKDERHFIGGYGYLFDQKGSGYTMGRDVIYRCLRKDDGFCAPSALTDIAERKIQDTAQNAIDIFYKSGSDYIASFASTVFETARHGDKVAVEMAEKNADWLVELILYAMGRYNCGNTIIFAGGIAYELENILREKVAKRFAVLAYEGRMSAFHPNLYFIKSPPVKGACKNAVLLFEDNIGSEFDKNFDLTINC